MCGGEYHWSRSKRICWIITHDRYSAYMCTFSWGRKGASIIQIILRFIYSSICRFLKVFLQLNFHKCWWLPNLYVPIFGLCLSLQCMLYIQLPRLYLHLISFRHLTFHMWKTYLLTQSIYHFTPFRPHTPQIKHSPCSLSCLDKWKFYLLTCLGQNLWHHIWLSFSLMSQIV